jgi:transposase
MKKGGEKVLSQIEEVSMDMTGKYKSLVRKLCPNAEVTVDIFPIIKIVNSQLNQAIIDPKKTALSLNIKEKYQVFCSLKESKYTLLKAEHKLSNKKNIKNQ